MSQNNRIAGKKRGRKMGDNSNSVGGRLAPTKKTPLKFDLATEIGVITDIERDGIDSLRPSNAQERALVEKLRLLQETGKLREYKKTLQEKLYLK